MCDEPVVRLTERVSGARPGKDRIRVAFVWADDRRCVGSVSGMPYAMACALESVGVEVVDVFSPERGSRRGRWGAAIRRALPEPVSRSAAQMRHVVRNWTERQQRAECERAMTQDAMERSERLGALVRPLEVDLVFGCCASTSLCNLRVDVPIVYFSDATAKLINASYPKYCRRSEAYRSACDRIEEFALKNVTYTAFASEWARGSAVADYGVSRSASAVVPMGAHITPADLDGPARHRAPPSRECLRICVIAADPVRKRTDFAVCVVEQLNQKGWNVRLDLVGPATRRAKASRCCHTLGTLKLDGPRDRARLASTLSQSHLLLLPSLAEAFGIAVCEAAHFGAPAIVSDAGGLPEAVRNDHTGLVVSGPVDASVYANVILQLVSDAGRFARMGKAASARATRELNWNHWARKMVEIFERAIQLKKRGPQTHPASTRDRAGVVVLAKKRPEQDSNLRPAV